MNIKTDPPGSIMANISQDQVRQGFTVWHGPDGEINWGNLPGYELLGCYKLSDDMGVDKLFATLKEDLIWLRTALR